MRIHSLDIHRLPCLPHLLILLQVSKMKTADLQSLPVVTVRYFRGRPTGIRKRSSNLLRKSTQSRRFSVPSNKRKWVWFGFMSQFFVKDSVLPYRKKTKTPSIMMMSGKNDDLTETFISHGGHNVSRYSLGQ